MKLLRSDSRLGSLIILSDTVHTRDKSLWNQLRDAQTFGTTLASAYILYYLTVVWLQLQIKEKIQDKSEY